MWREFDKEDTFLIYDTYPSFFQFVEMDWECPLIIPIALWEAK